MHDPNTKSTKSTKTVTTLLAKLKDMTRRVTEKDPTLKTGDTDFFFYKTMHDLTACTPIYLTDPAALDALLDATPEFEAYRGKGTQTINNGYPRILNAILMEIEFGTFSSSNPSSEYSEASIDLTLKKLAAFALPRAQGNGKPVRSKRAAQTRANYWEILTAISEHIDLSEALNLAKTVASNPKASTPEMQGALSYLLTHLSFENEEDDDTKHSENEKNNAEIKSIIETIRQNPPDRDILFQILDAQVDSGEIDQMAALLELEDWDEANDY